jgi:hypothetical protein
LRDSPDVFDFGKFFPFWIDVESLKDHPGNHPSTQFTDGMALIDEKLPIVINPTATAGLKTPP